jgi:hypothetical protein
MGGEGGRRGGLDMPRTYKIVEHKYSTLRHRKYKVGDNEYSVFPVSPRKRDDIHRLIFNSMGM